MEINITLTTTDIVAWWGAIIATSVLLWDIYKWKTSGPKLRMMVSGNMKTINIPSSEGKSVIMAQVDNIGTGETTITKFGFVYYETWLRFILKKPSKGMFIARPSPCDVHPLPHVLRPGGRWAGFAIQDETIEKMARNGFLICEVYYSSRGKPIQKRVPL